MKKINVALVRPPMVGHLNRGTGVYLDQLFAAYKEDSEVVCRLVEYHYLPRGADVVHYPYFDPFFMTLPVRFTKPTVITIHDVIPLLFPRHFPKGLRGFFKWQFQRWRAAAADAIITDSLVSQQDIVRALGIDAAKIHPIALAAADVFFKPLNKRISLYVQEKYALPERFVLYVGDANWNKNVPRLIQAAHKTQLQLVMVSPTLKHQSNVLDHPANSAVRIAYRRARRSQYVRVIGAVSQEELVALYNHATALAVPSFYEGFGLPMMEAFAAGTPVIAGRAGSLPEVAGGAAVLIDPENTEEIADVLQRVLSDKALRERLSHKGKKRAAQFSWHKTARKTIEVYRDMVS